MQIHFALDEPPRWDGDERLGRHGDRPPDARARRRLARGQRGRARPAPGRGDGRRRPAARRRPVARARGQVDPLDPAPGAAAPAEGRRGRRDRRRRRHLDRGAARALRRPDPGPDRPPRAESRVGAAEARRPLAGRHRARERQPRRRRHLLRLVRARPEPDLAAAALAARPPHAGRRASTTSARARIPARASAPARARSSPTTCCARTRARRAFAGLEQPPRRSETIRFDT